MVPFATIFDLELTAWEGSLARNWAGPGEYREIVQIGAVKLDAETLEEVGAFEVLTKPVRNPILSDYFIRLTHISDQQLARDGISFEEGYGAFLAFSQGAPCWSYGDDTAILTENIALHGLEGRMPPQAGHDIIPHLLAAGLKLAGVNSGKLATHVGAEWHGQEHDGLDDARSIAAALRVLIGQGMTNPFL